MNSIIMLELMRAKITMLKPREKHLRNLKLKDYLALTGRPKKGPFKPKSI